MEKLYDQGKIKAINVSNFYPDYLIDIYSLARVVPMVNQVELHQFNQQTDAMTWMKKLVIESSL